jgi:hypothetical protein
MLHSKRVALPKRIVRKIISFDKKLDTRPLLVMAITLATCALLIILRKPEAFTQAQFWAEDGLIWFGQAYNNGFWHTIAVPYSGTFSLLTRLVGYLATLVPLSYAPLFFSAAALLFQLLPVFIINSSRLRHIVRYRVIAIVASILYVCIPNSAEVFVNLANVQWHLGIAAFLILIADKPSRRRWIIFDIGVLGLAGLTGPLGILLVIIAFLMWCIKRNRSTFLNLAVLSVTSLCQTISLLIIQPGQRGGHMEMTFIYGVKMVVGQIFTGGLLGEYYVPSFYYDNFLLYGALALGLLIILYAVIKGPSWIGYANLFALMIFVSTLFSLTPLKGTDVWELLTHMSTGQRYWYIPIFVWLMTLLWVALAAKSIIMRLGCGCLLLLLFIGVPGSWDIAPLPDKQYQQQVDYFNTQPSGQNYKIPINPEGWYIDLRKH